MLSEEPAPTQAEAEADALLIFTVIAFTIGMVLAIIFDTSQVTAILQGLWKSILQVPVAFVVGIGHLLWNIITGVWSGFTSGASNVGSWLYNHTVGALP